MFRPLLLTLFALALACPAFTGELKVGHFDLQRVVGQSLVGKDAHEKYLEKASVFQKEIDQRTEALKRLKAEIEEQAKTLKQGESPSPAMVAMDKEAASQYREFQRLLGGYQDELKLYDSELTRGVLLKLQPVLGDFAEKHHYDYLFKLSDGLAYVSHQRDVSDELIAAFDQTYKKNN